MVVVFETIAGEVRSSAIPGNEEVDVLLRHLDRRARIVLGLFERQEEITTNDAARVLGLSPRQVRDLLNGWAEDGWLEISDAARKSRRYRLWAEYRWFIGGITAVKKYSAD
jgi:predicted ArsR family transcriptional regulator